MQSLCSCLFSGESFSLLYDLRATVAPEILSFAEWTWELRPLYNLSCSWNCPTLLRGGGQTGATSVGDVTTKSS